MREGGREELVLIHTPTQMCVYEHDDRERMSERVREAENDDSKTCLRPDKMAKKNKRIL